jgi:hypothetical protein
VCRVGSPNLLSLVNVIAPRYRTQGGDFLRIDFHHTNYGVDDLNGVVVGYADKGGLVIVAMRHWSQGSLQSPIQNVQKGPFGGIWGTF